MELTLSLIWGNSLVGWEREGQVISELQMGHKVGTIGEFRRYLDRSVRSKNSLDLGRVWRNVGGAFMRSCRLINAGRDPTLYKSPSNLEPATAGPRLQCFIGIGHRLFWISRNQEHVSFCIGGNSFNTSQVLDGIL